MDYTIKHIRSIRELDAALAFDCKVFGHSSERSNPAYSREQWLGRMKKCGDLMLCAEAGGEVIAIVFGRMENKHSITVGPVAVDARYRKHGLAREMMLLLETRAIKHGVRHLSLGAVESAEGFYKKLGYTGTLLIQSERHGIDELLSLNDKYQVIGTKIYAGTVNQVFLALSAIDHELQKKYLETFPGCNLQMVFEKMI